MGNEHTIKSYDAELARLTAEIVRMGELAASQLEAAIDHGQELARLEQLVEGGQTFVRLQGQDADSLALHAGDPGPDQQGLEEPGHGSADGDVGSPGTQGARAVEDPLHQVRLAGLRGRGGGERADRTAGGHGRKLPFSITEWCAARRAAHGYHRIPNDSSAAAQMPNRLLGTRARAG